MLYALNSLLFSDPEPCFVAHRPHSWRDTSSAQHAERYVHLASQQLAAEAFRRQDLSTLHNLVWAFEEVTSRDISEQNLHGCRSTACPCLMWCLSLA